MTARARIPATLHQNDPETVDFLQSLVDALKGVVPAGGRIDWYGTTVPTGFLLLTGQTLLRRKYLALAESAQSDITDDGTNLTLPTIANKAIRV